VQESAPDREDIKTELLARIDAVVGPEVVIASSSSGLLPTDIQAQCRHPERVLIGHPFNPVYLVPLVEVIPGKATAADAVDWALAFYTALGKYALHVRSEKPGYIANRLQEAIWREAMALVAEGAATTQEIDAAVAYGPGLRWSLMGPCFTFHLAGGEGGMKQMLHHFDPTGRPSWTYAPLPEWTDALKQALIDGTAAQAQGRDFATIERTRNERLLAVLEALGPGRLGVDA
jgi:carnitine 3-dehydrogenase